MRDVISRNLATFERVELPDTNKRHSAVAVTAVLDTDHDLRLSFLLTLRAPRMNAHAGQWAIPGGRIDPGEDPAAAARRELHEELGLSLPAPSVLGLLDDYETRSGFVITPVVMWGGELGLGDLQPNPAEVAIAYVIDAADLERADSPRFVTIPESDRPVIQLPLLGSLIHAPTAAVLYQFREVALHGRSTRVGHFEQPVFAWK